MKKFALAVLTVATLAATAAVAGPIEDRQAIMKSMAGPMKDAVAVSKAPAYDAAAAKTAMDALAEHMDKFITLFPKGSESGATKTGAGPTIWSDAAGFKAEAVKFSTDAKAAGAAKDTAGFAAAFKTVQADCGSCHKTYRVTAH